ncbi:MAG: P-loop NTPase fold protein, partial [Candidatus Paceibacterota bacterium]
MALGKIFPDFRKPKRIVDYQRDKALGNKAGDRFKHTHYVEVLKDILTKCETPINVGLYGRWGVGKSSIVHMLSEEIENGELSKEFTYIEVDAWGLSANALQQGILEEINSQLEVYDQSELEDQLYNVTEVESINYKNAFLRNWPLVVIVVGISIGILLYDQSIDLLTKLSA